MLHCEKCGFLLRGVKTVCPTCGRWNSFHVTFQLFVVWVVLELVLSNTLHFTLISFLPKGIAVAIFMTSLAILPIAAIHQYRVEQSVKNGLFHYQAVTETEPQNIPTPPQSEIVGQQWLTKLHLLHIDLRRIHYGHLLMDYLQVLSTPAKTHPVKITHSQPTNSVISSFLLISMTLCTGAEVLNWQYYNFTVVGFLRLFVTIPAIYLFGLSIMFYGKYFPGQKEEVSFIVSVTPDVSSLLGFNRIKQLGKIKDSNEYNALQLDHAIKEFNRLLDRTEVIIRNSLLGERTRNVQALPRLLEFLEVRRNKLLKLSTLFASVIEGETREIYLDEINSSMALSTIDIDSTIMTVGNYLTDILDEAEAEIQTMLKIA